MSINALMSQPAVTAPASRPQSTRPSEEARVASTFSLPWRQRLSVLVTLHFLCVFAALLWSYAPSPLLQRLRRVLSPYLTTLHLDPSPTQFFRTHGALDDTGHHIEVLVEQDEGRQWQPIRDYPRGTPARWRQLQGAKLVGQLMEADAEEDIARLMRDAAAAAIHQGRIVSAIRVRRQQLQLPEDVTNVADARRDPLDASYFETIYTGDVLTRDGAVFVVKRTTPAEAATVGGSNE
ncbi:MAG: hypothetical protein KDB14_12970 [Planctomycetales bacterium]|nr:hypothetical protein [Planctomycetales bacterium]